MHTSDGDSILIANVRKTIQLENKKGNKGCFFELPIYRFGEAVGNAKDMLEKIRRNLANDDIEIKLVNDGPYICLNWQHSFVANSDTHRRLNDDQFINKFRNILQKKRK